MDESQPHDIEEQVSKKPDTGITRRTVIKAAGAAAALAAIAGVGIKMHESSPRGVVTEPTDLLPASAELSIIGFPPVEGPSEMPQAKEWNAQNLQEYIEGVIAESLQAKESRVVELPPGEILIDRPITCVVPEGAHVRIYGHKDGSRLKLDPSLSDVPKEWGSFGERSILYFKDIEGVVDIQDVEFHGGSDRAGKEGYTPPKSPWDSMVLAVGKGVGEPNADGYRPGEQYDNAMDQAGMRKGKVLIENCNFYNSESEGVMVQNLGNVEFYNLRGKNLDVLANVAWCDDVKGTNILGERFTSDGIYINSAKRVELDNCSVKTSRQGYDLQGVKDAVLRQCHAFDCGKGYEMTYSETDKTTVSEAITLVDCATDGCMEVFSVGPVNKLHVAGGFHKGVGNWYKKYQEGEFLHRDGLVSPDDIASARSPIVTYELADAQGKVIPAKQEMRFDHVIMQFGKDRPKGYVVPKLPGITYSRAA